MRAFMRRRFWMALRYRLGVLGMCFAYLLAALEIPLPVLVHKNSSQPFPCQDHPCGCRTAEQCWSHCCCFTPEERWAWARAHNVEPPAYAEKPADRPVAQGWNTVKLRDRNGDIPTKNCCCTHEPAERAGSVSDGKATVAYASGSWLTTMAAWRCQGYSILWISAGAVLPVSPPTAWSPDDAPPSRICICSMHADIVPSAPPDPPPRFSLI